MKNIWLTCLQKENFSEQKLQKIIICCTELKYIYHKSKKWIGFLYYNYLLFLLVNKIKDN